MKIYLRKIRKSSFIDCLSAVCNAGFVVELFVTLTVQEFYTCDEIQAVS